MFPIVNGQPDGGKGLVTQWVSMGVWTMKNKKTTDVFIE